jgi:Protein of unknown function (DUF4242)
MGEAARSFIAECFWPGVTEAEVAALDTRAAASAGELTDAGEPVSYLGSILMQEDEVVLCLFEGTEGAVRTAAEQAEVPFARILEATASHLPQQPKGGTR